jgi:hypothetical protein
MGGGLWCGNAMRRSVTDGRMRWQRSEYWRYNLLQYLALGSIAGCDRSDVRVEI